jgi:LuxR family maltose regulon positive regulatory protein
MAARAPSVPAAHLPATVVRRRRLIDALDCPNASLFVVTGPAGSGKTVAVRVWAATTDRPTAWLSLDSRHGDPEFFLDALVAAVDAVVPGLRDAAWRVDPDDIAADHGIDRAVEHLADGPPATVVLDDLHIIDHTPTAGLLARLVRVLPDTNLTVVVCSRSDPPFNLNRMRLAGELVELRERDLRFDAAEAAEFFANFPQVELDTAQVARLAERTEGWVAGLQFAALSLVGRDDIDAFVERFAGSDRHVADFLLDEVLGRQFDDVRSFLLTTSVLDRMCADLCEHVTGRADAGAMLRRVEAEGLFLVPLDHTREWYRYHQLFAQLLQRELRLSDPAGERGLHERAAAWWMDYGDAGEAIDHLLAAGRLDQAFELLTDNISDLLRIGRHETLRAWLHRFPTEFVDATPGHQMMLTLVHARAGELERAKDVVDRARTRASAALLEDIGVHYDVAEAALAAIQGDPDTAISLGTKLWELRASIDFRPLPSDLATASLELWGYLPVALARAYALLDDRAGVRRWAAILQRQGPRLPSDLVGTLGAEAWVEARRGRLRAAAELADQALALGTEVGRGARRTMIGARTAMALVHRERDELEEAVDVLAPHIAAARREGHRGITTMGEIELARVDSARGDGDEAIARVLRVRRQCAAGGMSAFLAMVLDQTECRLRLSVGDVDRAVDLLDDIAPGPERTLLEARAALATGRRDEVDARLTELRADDDDRRRRFEAVALSARAAADAGDLAYARRLLGDVAEVARREGAVRTFRDEGFDILDVVLGGATANGVGAGSASAGAGARRATTAAAGAATGLVEPLSDRELSVLRYLPSRLSNREIGDELYVSLNTVKSHLKTIYRKLDVERRDEAVRRARQLGLI